jgi:hypothetical protein
MKNALAFIVTVLMFVQICKGQNVTSNHDTLSKNEFYSKEFKWRILIPAGFDTVSAEQYAALQKQGVSDLEKTSNSKIEDLAKRICAYKSTIFNYFEANQQQFDTNTDGDFPAHCRVNDNYVYDTYKKLLLGNAKLDTTISSEIIDGLIFQKFKLQFSINNKIALNMYVFSRLFEKKEFTMVMVFTNKAKGDLILNAWKNSIFDIK